MSDTLVYRDSVVVRHDTVYRTLATLRTIRTRDTVVRTLLRADTLLRLDTVRDTVRIRPAEGTHGDDTAPLKWLLRAALLALAAATIIQVKQIKN